MTCSGRKVALRIWTPAQDVPKTAHAMYSLKAAMKWDEEVSFLSFFSGAPKNFLSDYVVDFFFQNTDVI